MSFSSLALSLHFFKYYCWFLCYFLICIGIKKTPGICCFYTMVKLFRMRRFFMSCLNTIEDKTENISLIAQQIWTIYQYVNFKNLTGMFFYNVVWLHCLKQEPCWKQARQLTSIITSCTAADLAFSRNQWNHIHSHARTEMWLGCDLIKGLDWSLVKWIELPSTQITLLKWLIAWCDLILYPLPLQWKLHKH